MKQPSGQIYYDVNTKLTIDLVTRDKETIDIQFLFVSTIIIFRKNEGFDIHYDTTSTCNQMTTTRNN